MSILRSNKLINRAGTGAPELTYGASIPVGYGITGAGGINITGIVTSTEFDISGSSNSLSSGGLNVGVVTATTANITTLNVTNSNITTATVTNLNGTSGLVSLGSTLRTRGFVETQSGATLTGTTLSLNAANGTVFTHTTSANIGIVSFSGIRTDTAGSQTFTVLVTQGATPFSTTAATGIGTQLATVVTTGGVGYSTHIKVGGGTTLTLTNTARALDLLTFVVSYDGATSIANTSFTVVGFAATDFRGVVN